MLFMPQEAEQYLRRHKQESDLLLIGSNNIGVTYTEGVSSQNEFLKFFYASLICRDMYKQVICLYMLRLMKKFTNLKIL